MQSGYSASQRRSIGAPSPLLAAGLALLAVPAAAQDHPAASTASLAPAGVAVRVQGLVGTWYPPAGHKSGPAVLVLGGSEGGEHSSRAIGAKLAEHGYGVLALAYFRAEGLPTSLQNIPLEYFDRATAWIAVQPEVDAKRLGIYGISIGGEVALVVAARHPEYRAAVAAVPSSVV